MRLSEVGGRRPEGDLAAPEGDLAPPEGDLTAPEGDLAAPEGDLAAPEDDLAAPERDLGPTIISTLTTRWRLTAVSLARICAMKGLISKCLPEKSKIRLI